MDLTFLPEKGATVVNGTVAFTPVYGFVVYSSTVQYLGVRNGNVQDTLGLSCIVSAGCTVQCQNGSGIVYR